MLIRKTLVAAASLLLIAACGDDDPSPKSLVDVARDNGSFNTLTAALEAAGLETTLAGDGPFTVFAPTDEAFDRLPSGVVAALLNDTATLSKILTYHVAPVRAEAATVVTLDEVTTVEGQDVAIAVHGSTVVLNGTVQVLQTDVLADNGIIHVIDSVLLPPDLDFPGNIVEAVSAYPIFDTLVDAVVAASLAGALASDNSGDGFTLFAPTNAAFDGLGVDLSTLATTDLANVLRYHVVGDTVESSAVVGLSSAPTLEGSDIAIAVSGGAVSLNGIATVTRVDLRANNGVVHVIDAVLTP
jgi:uncharacterized surface protein with fasciclin (FAS1) repeats